MGGCAKFIKTDLELHSKPEYAVVVKKSTKKGIHALNIHRHMIYVNH
jgi:hypothetical protein